MAHIGYARVSTVSQSLDAQENHLRDAMCEITYADVMTGSSASRPEWDACRKALRSGDTLVVTRLDRMGRSLKHLLAVTDELAAKGVTLKVLEQAIDTSTPQGLLSMHLIGAMAQFELTLVSERTRSAMIGRARGRNGGRPKALSPRALDRAQSLYDAGGMTVAEISGAVGVSQATLYRSLATGGPRGKS